MRRSGKSKTCVWRWQERFAQEGCDALLRDKTRWSCIAPLGPEISEQVVALTLADMMAVAAGISASAVRRIFGGLSSSPTIRSSRQGTVRNFVLEAAFTGL